MGPWALAHWEEYHSGLSRPQKDIGSQPGIASAAMHDLVACIRTASLNLDGVIHRRLSKTITLQAACIAAHLL